LQEEVQLIDAFDGSPYRIKKRLELASYFIAIIATGYVTWPALIVNFVK
jgi:hypothetical protein